MWLTWLISISLVIVALVALLLVIVINIGMVRQIKLKSYIKKHASLNNQLLLLKNLRNATVRWNGNDIEMTEDKNYYLLLIMPFVTIGSLLYFAIEKPILGDSLLLGTVFLFLLFFVLFQLFAGLCFISDLMSTPKIKLMLSDFVTEDELSLLFSANNEDVRGGCDNSILSYIVYYPDEMIPFLLHKEEISKYLEVQANLNAVTKGKEEFLTTEQLQENRQIQKEFKKTIEPLKVFLQDFNKATIESYYINGQKDKMDISKIQEQFDSLHREAREKLLKLSQVVPMRPETNDETIPLSKAIQELNLVVQSEQVSGKVKSEAKELIDRILEKETRDRLKQKKEMEEFEALSVIEASKQFYQL